MQTSACCKDYCIMLSSEQNTEECDATTADSSNEARYSIFFLAIFHFFGLIFAAYGKRFE